MGTSVNYEILGERLHDDEKILTNDACLFLQKLHESFAERREQLLALRNERQKEINHGRLPNFREDTKEVREGDWKIAPIPDILQDRRVEITGPTSNRRMVVNALNSGAKVFMADFEDANSPTWENSIQGQINMYDAIRRKIDFMLENGKEYRLKEEIATLLVRPRGLHLLEKHFLINKEPISASLFDFGLYFYHNAKELLDRGLGPFFYIPKLEYSEEAAFWNDVFNFAQDELGIPRGTIKATVLIETLTGAFEADEILYELREHSSGLNCGRWDYIFSYIKKLNKHPQFLLPDRSEVTMTVNFMRAYSLYVIQTCHKRGAHAIGGMAAQIPIKDDEEKNLQALEKVRADKLREVKDGHDGTWVAHPGLVSVAMEVFNEHLPTPNQIARLRDDYTITQDDLLAVPDGKITEAGLRQNIVVGLKYMEAWLQGQGAVPIFNLMEDVATAEISRTQLWHWINHPDGRLEDGRKIDLPLVEETMEEELKNIEESMNEDSFKNSKFPEAKELFLTMIKQEELIEFMTLPAYEYLINKESVSK